MNTLLDFENILYAIQDKHFEEKRDGVKPVYTEYTKAGNTKNADYRSITSVGITKMAYTPEGGTAYLDQYEEGTTRVVKFKKFSTGLIVPEELLMDMASNTRVKEDNVKLFTRFAEDANEAAKWTKEVITADFLASGTSTTATNTWPGTFRDGLALFSASHVTQKGATTWSNLQTAAPISEVAIKEGITMLSNIPDETGRPQGAVENIGIVYGRYNQWRVDEILGTEKQEGTANNTINPLYGMGIKKILNPYLSNTFKGWMLIDLKNHQLLHFDKMKPTINRDVDPLTGNRIQRCIMRYAIDADSSKGVVLNAGA